MRETVSAVLAFDSENDDARAFLSMAEGATDGGVAPMPPSTDVERRFEATPAAPPRALEIDINESRGARVEYREIAGLSHAYPREENPLILDWLLHSPA